MANIGINMDSLKPKREWNRHKVKDGNNIYRITPPFGENSNGYPYQRWYIIWGLLDPETGRKRPYASPITSEGKCPVFEYVKVLTDIVEQKKAQLAASGVSADEIKEQLKPLNSILWDMKPKKIYAYNAIDKAGTVGILEIKQTAQDKLKALMLEYIQQYQQDPTSLNSEKTDSGIWFNFIREGVGRDTTYEVKKSQDQQEVNGQIGYFDDRSALPDNVVTNYDSLAYDLTSVYQMKSYDEIKEILLANLSAVAESCPEAIVEGFEVPSASKTTGSTTSTKPAATQAAPQGTVPVGLKLDDPTDVPFDGGVKTSATTASATVAASVEDTDDIFAMAEDIVNGV